MLCTSVARRGPLVALAVAVAAICGVWLFTPPHGIPLYDGIGFPDEPYRYVDPPLGAKPTRPPTSAIATINTPNGSNSHAFYANSAEVAPQVAIFVGSDAITAARAVTTVVLRADPVAPDRQPAGATIDGNIYRVTATAPDGSAGGVTARSPASGGADASTVTMRATSARQPHPHFFYRATPAAAWHEVATAPAGIDIYRTELVGFGDYVLAWKSSENRSTGNHFSPSALLIAGPVLLIVGAIATIRVSRRRST